MGPIDWFNLELLSAEVYPSRKRWMLISTLLALRLMLALSPFLIAPRRIGASIGAEQMEKAMWLLKRLREMGGDTTIPVAHRLKQFLQGISRESSKGPVSVGNYLKRETHTQV